MPSFRHGDATIYCEEFGQGLLKAGPGRVASAVLAQPIGRVGPMPAGRTPRFQAWAESLTDHPEATPEVLDAFYRNLYGTGFVCCVDRAFVSTCAARAATSSRSGRPARP
jgi:hypothetical protein